MATIRASTVLALAASVFFGVFVLAAEWWLSLNPPRSKVELIEEFRKGGDRAYPASTSQIVLLETGFRGLPGHDLVPLGGISRTTTVFCREDGDYLVYKSDRYGFHNPDELWDEPVEVVAIGDSYVQGACVPSSENMISTVRRSHPATLNLGSFGNGPLSHLATLKEYAAPLKPKVVLWFYVSNDLGIDLGIERASPVLMRYLWPGFSQRLRARQSEIDGGLAAFLDRRLEAEVEKEDAPQGGKSLPLPHLSRLIRRTGLSWFRPPPAEGGKTADYDRPEAIDWHLFRSVLGEAARTVQGWNGRVLFVIVPDARMLAPVPADANVSPARHIDNLKRQVSSLGIPIADLREVFRSVKNPWEYYSALDGFYGHFNERGYRLVGAYLNRFVARTVARTAPPPSQKGS